MIIGTPRITKNLNLYKLLIDKNTNDKCFEICTNILKEIDKLEKEIKNLKMKKNLLFFTSKKTCKGKRQIDKKINEKTELIENIKKDSEILGKYYRKGLNVQALVANIRTSRMDSNELVPLHFRNF